MPEYQVIARRYRPKTFKEIVGQSAIVTTLINAIKRNSTAHAYLFCGSRGTGKTTLARILAKALNCQNLDPECNPCNQCSSCAEINSGHSLDVLEIDGASHRGIDDIRQINETVGYTAASGKFKVYIIDEVHMLTKEAFNALLKTLEEPPGKVKFLFATTEPHKVPPTILSRCQRFNLSRIPLDAIMKKLGDIAQDLGVTIQEEALRILGNRAEGGLRDAESLLDQILAFHSGTITAEVVTSILGIVPREVLFSLDQAGRSGNIAAAFDVAHKIFSEGKDILGFLDTLIEHFRNILLVKLSGPSASFLSLSESDREHYAVSAKCYTQEQCLSIIEMISEAVAQNRFSSSGRMALEAILLKILRSHQRIPYDMLLNRLAELEQKIVNTPTSSSMPSITEDPTPTAVDLGKDKPSAPIEVGARLTEEAKASHLKSKSRLDTVMQFAAIELEGTLQKH